MNDCCKPEEGAHAWHSLGGKDPEASWHRTRVEPSRTGKNVIKIIPKDLLLHSDKCLNQTSSEKLPLAADRSRGRNPQPNIRKSLENPTKEGEVGLHGEELQGPEG